MKVTITEGQEHLINVICQNFHNTISSLQVRNWLENFKSEEFDVALLILSNLKYFNLDEIITDFNESLQRLLKDNPGVNKFHVLGLGEFGKSGKTMIYFFKKTPVYNDNLNRFSILSHSIKLKAQGIKNNDHLLLIDDIIGSGWSFTSFYNHELKQQFLRNNIHVNVYVLTVAYMSDSKVAIQQIIPGIKFYGNKYVKAFSSGPSVFGYRRKMLPVREFAYNYGKGLFSTKDRANKTVINHPLGYYNSQSLIIFAHSVPNNTLPIIWSNKGDWLPLFPRSAEGKISAIRSFYKETRYWTAIAYKIGLLKKNEPTNPIFNHIDFSILAVIKLKRQRRITPIICQLLGITYSIYLQIIEEGVQRNIFDKDENLTPYGVSVYDGIVKSIRQTNFIRSNTQMNIRFSRIYVPKIFLGKT